MIGTHCKGLNVLQIASSMNVKTWRCIIQLIQVSLGKHHDLKEKKTAGFPRDLKIRASYLNGHSQLWDRADLDTTFVSLKRVYLHLEFRFNLA